jgi:hypothetical protein
MRAATDVTDSRPRTRRARAAVAIAVAALLVSSSIALAAKPKPGARFTGTSSEFPINGFRAPVSFTVAKNRKSLTGFTYSSIGCFGAGGFRSGIDYYTQPSFIVRAGTVKVASSGRFSVTGALFNRTAFGTTTTTTISINGSFTKPKAAKGTIRFSQKASGQFTSSCGPATITFTASTR